MHWVMKMNKTMAIMAVALSVFTAFFIIGMGTELEADGTIQIDGASYSIITDADTVSYTDESIPSKRIYIDSPSVKAEAFKGCTTIQYVVFSDKVKTIGDSAFEGCSKLLYVKMTQVQSIGDYAFKGTSILNNNISSALTSIGKYAFSECSGMYSPILSGTGVTELKEGVFKNSDVKIEDLRNITKIAGDAFEGTSLKGQIVDEKQKVKLNGIPEITLGDFDFKNLDVTSTKNVLYLDFWVEPNMMLTKTDTSGTSEYRSELFVYNTGDYACLVPYNEVNTHIDARTTTLHFQDFLGMDDIVHKSGDGKLTMPVPKVASGMFSAWSVEGLNGNVKEITEAQFCELGTTIGPIASFATRTITYDHSQIKGVTGLPSSTTFTVGDRYAELDDVDGYEFSGWRVDGKFYSAGSLIDTYSDHTAVSVWDALTCKVEIMGTDGMVTETIQVEKGSRLDLSTLDYDEADGEEFIGWALTMNGPMLVTDPQINSDLKLYPLTKARQSYTVTFVDDGKVLGTQQCYKGKQIAIEQQNPAKDGKIFENWVLRETGTKYFQGDKLMLSKDIELEAVWKTIKVRLYYHLDLVERCEYDWGTMVTIGSESAVKRGYELLGWSLNMNGAVDYRDGETVRLTETIELYPCWAELGKLKITCHDYNGRMTVKEVEEGDSFTVPKPSARDQGVFLGWSLGMDRHVNYTPGDSFVVYNDVDLFEVWDMASSHTVVCHDHAGGTRTATVEDGSTFTVPRSSDRSDAVFLGWATTAMGAVAYQPGDYFNVTSDMDLYEVWKMDNNYKITIHDHDNMTTVTEVPKGSRFTVPKPTEMTDGFLGWATTYGGTARYTPGDSFTVTEDMDLYEVWSSVTTLYVTTHDYTGKQTMTDVESGKRFTVPKPIARDQATFLGWATSPEGTPMYTPGDSFTVTSDMDLYEVWKTTDVFSVILHRYSGETTVSSVEEGKMFTVPKGSSNSQGTFLGWSMESEGTVDYTPGDTFAVTSDTHLYEVWKTSTTYDVILHDYTGKTKVSIVGKDTTFTAPRPSTRDGWTFSGWALTYSGSPAYMPGDAIRVSSNMDLYEIWSDRTQQVVSHEVACHGSSGKTTIAIVTDKGTYTVPKALSDSEGTFLGWSLSRNGTVQYTPGDSFTVTEDTDLYEVWDTTVEYTVTVHYHTGESESSKMVSGSAYTVPSASARDGYTFMGWSTRPSGSASYLPGAQIVVASDMDLYQVWTQKQTFSVTVHDQNGSTYNGFVGESLDVPLPAMTRDGYDHIGWTTAYNGQTAQYPAPGTAQATSSCSFYPVWKEKETVNIMVHMAGTDTVNHTVYKGDSLTLPASFGKVSGKMHLGWTLSPDGTGRFFSAGSTIHPEESMELFVSWSEPDIIRITFMSDGTQVYSVNASAGSTYDLSKVGTPSKEGYGFLGWSTEEGSARVAYDADDAVTATESITLHAVWEKLVEVTYHNNGKTETEYYEAGSEVTLKTVSKDGYKFKGWSASVDGQVLESPLTVYRNVDLFAIWEKEEQSPSSDKIIVIDGEGTDKVAENKGSGGSMDSGTIAIAVAVIAGVMLALLFVVRRA